MTVSGSLEAVTSRTLSKGIFLGRLSTGIFRKSFSLRHDTMAPVSNSIEQWTSLANDVEMSGLAVEKVLFTTFDTIAYKDKIVEIKPLLFCCGGRVAVGALLLLFTSLKKP